MILVDVGVWLAAVWGRHVHFPVASDWLNGQAGDLVFCRVTQMGLLRLLSDPAIMGDDSVDRSVIRQSGWNHCCSELPGRVVTYCRTHARVEIRQR